MTVQTAALIPAKIAEDTQTTQYASTNKRAKIDSFVVTNYSAAAQTISVNLVTAGDTAGTQNLVVKAKQILPGETVQLYELINQTLMPGDFISTIASAATSLNMRCSGREVTT